MTCGARSRRRAALPAPVSTSTRKRQRRRGSRGFGCTETSSRATTSSSFLDAAGAPASLPIAHRVPEQETRGQLRRPSMPDNCSLAAPPRRQPVAEEETVAATPAGRRRGQALVFGSARTRPPQQPAGVPSAPTRLLVAAVARAYRFPEHRGVASMGKHLAPALPSTLTMKQWRITWRS